MLTNSDNWEKINISVYNSSYEDAKLRYDDMSSDSENITKTTRVILIGNLALLAWFSKQLEIQALNLSNLWVLIPLMFFLLVILIMGISIFLPRIGWFKGIAIKTIISDLEAEYMSETYLGKQEHLYAYYRCKILNNRLLNFRTVHYKRANLFKNLILVSLANLVFIVVILALNTIHL